MIALASLPPWNDLGIHAGVRPDCRNGGRAGVSAQEASGPATRQHRGSAPRRPSAAATERPEGPGFPKCGYTPTFAAGPIGGPAFMPREVSRL